jgi:hypothetical protein
MKFKNLLELPFDSFTNSIDVSSILDIMPSTPIYIAEEFYRPFGRQDIHQSEYGFLDIAKIKWSKRYLTADVINSSSILKDFSPWVNTVSERVQNFSNKGWECIDTRQDVIDYWQNNKTWLKAPLFLERKLLNNKNNDGIHLLEGHTRIGILKGCLKHLLISSDSIHEVWIGC